MRVSGVEDLDHDTSIQTNDVSAQDIYFYKNMPLNENNEEPVVAEVEDNDH